MKKLTTIILILITINSFSQTKLYNGDILIRNVVGSNLLFHYGVVYEDKILEFNQTGLHHSTLDAFLQGKKIIKIDSTLRHSKDINERIKNTIKEYKNKPYSFKNNCESFANQIKKGVPSSLQYEIIDYTFQIINSSLIKNKK